MQLIITVDTELSSHPGKIGILGNIGRAEYGISKIMDICDKYDTKATFFVDVYGYKRIGDDMKEICHNILKRGHDLQLHTHPDVYDRERGYMALYSLDEQIKIIAEGKEYFEKVLGVTPIAHRAGDWGADYNTLQALRFNNIVIDSSMFYKWETCALNNSLRTINQSMHFGDLLEIPATVFESPRLGTMRPIRLLDLNANHINENIYILNKIRKSDTKMCMFNLHSFSFLHWNRKRTKYSINYNKIREFEIFLKHTRSQDDIKVLTMRDIFEAYSKADFLLDTNRHMPRSNYFFAILRMFYHLSSQIMRP